MKIYDEHKVLIIIVAFVVIFALLCVAILNILEAVGVHFGE